MPDESVVEWLVPLVGHQHDLEDFPLWLSEERIQVVQRDGNFNLLIPAELVGGNHDPVLAVAADYVQFMNGVGRLLYPEFRPVSASDRAFGLSANGAVISTVLSVQPGEIRMKGGVLRAQVGDQLASDHRQAAGAPFMRAAASKLQARHALILMGKDHLSWSDIFLAFELVQSDVGGMMHTKEWISKTQADLLTATANSYSSLGLEARHGRDRGNQPPASPMKKEVADKLIRDLVRPWLMHLAAPTAIESGAARQS